MRPTLSHCIPRHPIFLVPLGLTMLVCITFLLIDMNVGVSNGTSGKPYLLPSVKFGIWHEQSPGYCTPQPSAYTSIGNVSTAEQAKVNRSSTLSIASQIFVISLPRRTDRRAQMELLRSALGLQWKYVDGVDISSPSITRIIEEVQKQRIPNRANKKPFRWPKYINAQAYSSERLGLGGSDNWTLPKDQDDSSMMHHERNLPGGYSGTFSRDPLTCAMEDDTHITFEKGLPEYKLLTPAKIACWSSHLSVIRDIAEDKHKEVSIVLEDDVDMGWDIRERLNGVWDLLPAGWDIVFLGKRFPPVSATL